MSPLGIEQVGEPAGRSRVPEPEGGSPNSNEVEKW